MGKLRKNGHLTGIVCQMLFNKQLESKDKITEEIHKENLQSIERKSQNLCTKSSIANEIWKIRQRNYEKMGNKLAIKSPEGQILTSNSNKRNIR